MKLLLILPLAFTSVLTAALYTVESSATCAFTTGDAIVQDPGNTNRRCHASGTDNSFAEANVDIFVDDIPDEVGQAPNVGIYAAVTTRLVDIDPDTEAVLYLHESVQADVYAKVTLFLQTSGPIRDGVLRANLNQELDGGMDLSRREYGHILPANFQLGTRFEMTLSVLVGSTIFATDEPGDGGGNGFLKGGFGGQDFRFPRVYEADGVTPAHVFFADNAPVPEPSTALLLPLGVLLIAGWRKISTKKTLTQ